jgi:hypothetical protein
MSRGLGAVQRRLVAVFRCQPGRRFTIAQLAEIAYPGEPIERKHLVSVGRALKNLPNLNLDLWRSRRGTGTPGWRYSVRLVV